MQNLHGGHGSLDVKVSNIVSLTPGFLPFQKKGVSRFRHGASRRKTEMGMKMEAEAEAGVEAKKM
jgi:hypothetical protein